MKALFIGRFQPLHKGHLSVMKKLLIKHDELIIGVGSTNKCTHKRNPFTYRQVNKMIKENIQGNYEIIKVNDCDSDIEWINCITNKLGTNYIVYSGNNWVKKLFKNIGVKVVHLEREKGINATQVRTLIREGNDSWKKLVPIGTIKVISSLSDSEISH